MDGPLLTWDRQLHKGRKQKVKNTQGKSLSLWDGRDPCLELVLKYRGMLAEDSLNSSSFQVEHFYHSKIRNKSTAVVSCLWHSTFWRSALDRSLWLLRRAFWLPSWCFSDRENLPQFPPFFSTYSINFSWHWSLWNQGANLLIPDWSPKPFWSHLC